MDDPAKIYHNQLSSKAYLTKLLKNSLIQEDTFYNDYSVLFNAVKDLNLILKTINIYDSEYVFAYRVLTFLNKLEQLNRSELHSLLHVTCSLLIVEDLKHKYQIKKMRFTQLFKVQNKAFEKLQSLQSLLEFNQENKKTSTQFVLFFSPLRFDMIAQDFGVYSRPGDGLGGIGRTQGRKNIAQRIYITDLNKDKEALKKFFDLKPMESFRLALFRFQVSLTKSLRTPLVLRLNAFQRFLVKFVLITLFVVDSVSSTTWYSPFYLL